MAERNNKQKIGSFIITLTGPSGCGKSYVTDRILELEQVLAAGGLVFHPVRQAKYVTRALRKKEIKADLEGKIIDVQSVEAIPEDCDLKYRTYGKEYGLSSKELWRKLDAGQSPVVVINDVRVVEEMKRVFKNRVLALFLFREIPNLETYKKQAAERGGDGALAEMQERYNKAIAIYRTYIENIGLFNRVILNVGKEGDPDYTKMQVENLIRGVLDETISMVDRRNGKPKLFVVAGSAASGKDEIIQAVNDMGKLQAFIIRKYTSRNQDDDDGDEMICKGIPHQGVTDVLEEEYKGALEAHEREAKARLAAAGDDLDKRVDALAQNLSAKKRIPKTIKRFWDVYNAAREKIADNLRQRMLQEADASHRVIEADLNEMEQEALLEMYLRNGFHDEDSKDYQKLKKTLEAENDPVKAGFHEQKLINLILKEASLEHHVGEVQLNKVEKLAELWKWYEKDGYHAANVDVALLRQQIEAELEERFFETNKEYLDLQAMKMANPDESKKAAYAVDHDGTKYVLYENNKGILYGFALCTLPDKTGIDYQRMCKEGKHCLLVASHREIFELVRPYFENNAVRIFAYSQISEKEFREKSTAGVLEKKLESIRKETLNYSQNIAYYDHVTIYAESELSKQKGGKEEELIDQIFRLFRYYSPEVS